MSIEKRNGRVKSKGQSNDLKEFETDYFNAPYLFLVPTRTVGTRGEEHIA
jgi:hypothetical protein